MLAGSSGIMTIDSKRSGFRVKTMEAKIATQPQGTVRSLPYGVVVKASASGIGGIYVVNRLSR